MMIDVFLVCTILIAHFAGDFILQTDKMALNKSKSNKWLLYHIAVYNCALLMFGPVYAVTNSAIHFCVDYITSRCTSYLWKRDERHWFFVVIGLDQLIHTVCLLLTYKLIWGPV